MRYLNAKLFLISVAMMLSATASFALPACPSSGYFNNCFGTYTYGPNSEWAGDKYVGESKNDKRNGQGTYTWTNGNKYVGEYKDGKRNGQGTYTYANGNKYVGEYKDGKRNGQGTYTFADGTVEEGIWKDDEFQYAKKLSPPVPVAKTPTQDDEIISASSGSDLPDCPSSGNLHNCFGTYTYAHGSKYVGEFRDNEFNGQGTFKYSSGTEYIGEFKNGKFNGQGILTYADGTVEDGLWKDDAFVGK